MVRATRLPILLILIVGCHDDGGDCPNSGVAKSVEATPIAGSLDKTFGTDGVLTLNFSDWYDYARAIAVDAEAIYVAGTVQIQKSPKLPEGHPQLWKGHIEKRRRSDGAQMWPQGIATNLLFVTAMALAPDALYVVGDRRDRRPGGSFDTYGRIEKRSLVDGSLVWAQEARQRSILGAAIDSSALYVAGDERDENGFFRWRVEKRRLTDGNAIFSVPGVSSPYSHGPSWTLARIGRGMLAKSRPLFLLLGF